MKSKRTKIISLLMALAMLLTALPLTAIAAGDASSGAKAVELFVGETKVLNSHGWSSKWTSDNEDVVTVTSKGMVKGISAGNATVTETYKNLIELIFGGKGTKITYTVKVSEKTVDDAEHLKVGDTLKLKAKGHNTKWTSSDESVATVSASGEVTAVAPGSVTITAKSTVGLLSFLGIGRKVTQEFKFAVDAETPDETYYTVTFNSNGGSAVTSQQVKEGECAVEPEAPELEEYTFDGWYSNEELTQKFDFNTQITGDITLYAKWNEEGVYTVSFESNGGSEVTAQQVNSGEYAVKPDDPTMEGFDFVAWYADETLQVLFDFNTAITSNITVYAKWRETAIEIRSFIDEPDQDVEIYSFTTDTWDILINTQTTVTFTAEIFSNIKLESTDVSVVDSSNTTVGYMLDDGTNGDETANDGIFTLSVDLTSNTIKTVNYHAVAHGIESSAVAIGYYQAHTEEDYKKADSIAEQLNVAIAEYIDSNGYIIDGKYNDAISAITDCLEQLKSDGEVSSYTTRTKGFKITLTNGISFNYSISVNDGTDSGIGRASIATFQPFKNTYSDQSLNVLSDSATDGSAQTIADESDEVADIEYFFNENADLNGVTLEKLKTLSSHQVILWHGHGGYEDDLGSMLMTGELVNPTTSTRYDADISNGRLSQDYSAAGRNTYAITGGFIQRYVGDLSGAFVYLAACDSGLDMLDGVNNTYSLTQAFINKGATTVIANSETIYTEYNTKMERDVVSYMCETNESDVYYTASEALAHAKSINGSDDGSNRHATPIIFPRNTTSASEYRFFDTNLGTLSGNVKSANDNSTISNALIRIYTTTGNMVKSVRTGADGSYSIKLEAGDYVLKVSAGNYRSEKMAVTVIAYTTAYTETFLMMDNSWTIGEISGIITNAVTGTAVSDVTVKLRSGWNNTQGTVIATTTTNSNGLYEFSGDVGVYTIEYSKSGFSTGYKNIVILASLMTQNAVISPITSEGVYRIVLSWSDAPEDLDSHLVGPTSSEGRFHLYYPYADANSGSPWSEYVKLDIDNTSITSHPENPETTTIVQLIDGKYVYSVHDYTNRGDGNSKYLSNSAATVSVYKGDTLIDTFPVPTNVEGTIWTVFEIEGDTIIPANRFGNGYADDVEAFDPYY